MSSLFNFELLGNNSATTLNSQFEDPFLDSYSAFNDDIWQLRVDNLLSKDNTMIPSPDIESTTSSWEERTPSEIDQLCWDSSISAQPVFSHECETPLIPPVETPSTASIQTDGPLFISFPTRFDTSGSTQSDPDHQSSSQIGPSKRLRRLDRQMRRREQNRASQKRYRASKEAKLHDAHEKIKTLELHLEFRIERNTMLEREWLRMKAELEILSTLP